MNPDFVSVPERSTVEQAIESVRRSEIPTEQTHTAAVVDATGHLVGTVSVVALVKAAGHDAVGGLVDPGRPAVSPEADLPEIARLMTDYNLMSLAVVDGEGKPIGLLAVDDVLELTLARRLAATLRARARLAGGLAALITSTCRPWGRLGLSTRDGRSGQTSRFRAAAK